MKADTVIWPTDSSPLTTIGELTPEGLSGGIVTGVVLEKVSGVPRIPEGSRIKFVWITSAHLTIKTRLTGVPQTKFGKVLMVNGRAFSPVSCGARFGNASLDWATM